MVSVKRFIIFLAFFIKINLKIMFSYGLERKQTFKDDKNVNFIKSKKRVFSKGVNRWFQSKVNFVLSKISLEIMLSYGLERKEPFHDNKNVTCYFCKV